MKPSGHLTAAISLLEDILTHHRPISRVLMEWGQRNRFAGSSDRKAIGDLLYETLRRKSSLAHTMESTEPRALLLGTIRFLWKKSLEDLATLVQDPYGPGPLTEKERQCLSKPAIGHQTLGEAPSQSSLSVLGDFPSWMEPFFERAFAGEALNVAQSLSQRAPIDLRMNPLKTDMKRLSQALKRFPLIPSPLSPWGLRLEAPPPGIKMPSLESDLHFQRGWFELQDTASQIAAFLSMARPGLQVLDLCAGSGGKTLPMAAMMQNKGQIFAYDKDPHRLKPILARLQRNGVRNTQVIPAHDHDRLETLMGKMDRVFVDAPCTGTGAWRRRPDHKWRLTQEHLEAYCAEQALLLKKAARFLKPQGYLIYATCSVLYEENEAQILAFCDEHPDFKRKDTRAVWREAIGTSPPQTVSTLPDTLTLTPYHHGSDGFFVAVLTREERAEQ